MTIGVERPASSVVLPQQVAAFAAFGIPAFDEALFRGDAVLLRPAPIRPIQRIGRRGMRDAAVQQRTAPPSKQHVRRMAIIRRQVVRTVQDARHRTEAHDRVAPPSTYAWKELTDSFAAKSQACLAVKLYPNGKQPRRQGAGRRWISRRREAGHRAAICARQNSQCEADDRVGRVTSFLTISNTASRGHDAAVSTDRSGSAFATLRGVQTQLNSCIKPTG